MIRTRLLATAIIMGAFPFAMGMIAAKDIAAWHHPSTAPIVAKALTPCYPGSTVSP